MQKRWVGILSALVLVGAQAAIAPADRAGAIGTTWTVQSTGDGPVNPLNCPGSLCRLRDALSAAGAGDSINFAVTGTITLTDELLIAKNLTITGPGASRLTIDGANQGRIFLIATGYVVSISGMTLTHGEASDTTYPAPGGERGGGAILSKGNLTLNGMVIDSNVVSCVVDCPNNGLNGYGGGIASSTSSILTVTASTISNNSTTFRGGGLSFNSAGHDLVLTDVKISANHAGPAPSYGGGLAVSYGNIATLEKVLISGNSAESQGGGLFADEAAVDIMHSTIEDNSAPQGAGICVETAAAFRLGTSTVAGNISTDAGGGLYNNGTPVTVVNSTLQGNTAGGTAGGGAIFQGSGSLRLHNSTLAGNTDTGGYAAGLYVGNGTINVANTIMAGNSSTDCKSYVAWASNTSNLIQVNDASWDCPAPALTGDPKLGALGDNGGPTDSMALRAGSPALEAGDGTTCTDVNTVDGVDQRGRLRPIDGDQNGTATCDVGAFEHQIPTASDFDNDGKTDPAKLDATSHVLWVLESGSGLWASADLGSDATEANYVRRSDLDGDGKADPAKWDAGTNSLWYIPSSGGGWQGLYLGPGDFVYVPGSDYDRDTQTDPAKFDSGSNALWLLRSSSNSWLGMYLGPGTYSVVPGSDYDGDHRTDPATFNSGTNALWYRASGSAVWIGVYLGPGSYDIVPASDFDGDGRTDAATFNPSSHVLWYLPSSTGVWQGLYMGAGTLSYVPAADFDGDGMTDPAVFDSAGQSLWYYESGSSTWQGVYMGPGTYAIVN